MRSLGLPDSGLDVPVDDFHHTGGNHSGGWAGGGFLGDELEGRSISLHVLESGSVGDGELKIVKK